MRVAQKFVIKYNLFLANGVRCDVERDTDYSLSAANRYCDSEGIYQGQLKDLEDVIPDEWREARKTLKSFQSAVRTFRTRVIPRLTIPCQFHSQQGETRTTIARRIAKSDATAHCFPMFDVKNLQSAKWRRENCRQLIGYRSDWGQGRAGYSALDAPIIHANHEAPNGYDLDTIFKGECPQRVRNILLVVKTKILTYLVLGCRSIRTCRRTLYGGRRTRSSCDERVHGAHSRRQIHDTGYDGARLHSSKFSYYTVDV